MGLSRVSLCLLIILSIIAMGHGARVKRKPDDRKPLDSKPPVPKERPDMRERPDSRERPESRERPDSRPESRPDSRPESRPDSGSDSMPDSRPDNSDSNESPENQNRPPPPQNRKHRRLPSFMGIYQQCYQDYKIPYNVCFAKYAKTDEIYTSESVKPCSLPRGAEHLVPEELCVESGLYIFSNIGEVLKISQCQYPDIVSPGGTLRKQQPPPVMPEREACLILDVNGQLIKNTAERCGDGHFCTGGPKLVKDRNRNDLGMGYSCCRDSDAVFEDYRRMTVQERRESYLEFRRRHFSSNRGGRS